MVGFTFVNTRNATLRARSNLQNFIGIFQKKWNKNITNSCIKRNMSLNILPKSNS